MITSFIEHLPTAHYRAPHAGRSTAAILRATLAELDDRGYAAASLRTIAGRADVPLEAVFAQWRSKQHLVSDAIHLLARGQPTPDTGDLRADLLQVVEALVDLLTHPGAVQVLRSLAATGEPGGSADTMLGAGLLTERRAALRRIIERGQRRQQFPTAVHPGVVADAVIGALIYRLLLSNDAVSRHTAALITDVVIATHASERR